MFKHILFIYDQNFLLILILCLVAAGLMVGPRLALCVSVCACIFNVQLKRHTVSINFI